MTVGFKPSHAMPNRFRVYRLNHSAKSTMLRTQQEMPNIFRVYQTITLTTQQWCLLRIKYLRIQRLPQDSNLHKKCPINFEFITLTTRSSEQWFLLRIKYHRIQRFIANFMLHDNNALCVEFEPTQAMANRFSSLST